MAQLPIPAANDINTEVLTEVWIAGIKKSSVIVDRVEETAGLDPAAATILFPTRDYGAHPCDENDRVLIYVNRLYREKPVFRGYVSGFGDFVTQEAGEYVQVFVLDDLVLLSHDCCDTDYNLRDTRDGRIEYLNIRTIAQDIQTQMNSRLGTAAPNLMTWSFPRDIPGELVLFGQPYNSALSTLLDQAGDFKYFYRREYTESATLIYAFRIGSGEIAHFNRATDITVGPRSQPDGVANIGEARRQEQYADVVNKARVIGDRKVKETALTLSAAWDTTKNDYLLNIEAYTKKGTEDDPNPHYDAEAERIGRAWVIPKITQVYPISFSEYPEIEPRLLSAPDFNYTNASTDFGKPFIAYQFAGEGTYQVTWDYSLKDNELFTARPLMKDAPTTGASIVPAIASIAYFNVAYKERDRLLVDINKQGAVNRTITRYFQRPDEYKYKYKADPYFTIGTVGYYSATLSQTIEQYYGCIVTVDSVVINHTATAQAWGADRLRATRDERLEITYELPRMDLNYRVGMRVKENGVTLDANIFSITYDLIGRNTTISAVSR